jgi:2-C-methyl-D-erythritol 4-phosphate cytidylyltransferase
VSVWAVLAAAGRGERFGGDRPKAFERLGAYPLLAEPLRRLDESDWIDWIVVAAPPGWEEPCIVLAEELALGKVAAVVTGGDTRAASVRAALAEIPDDAAVVLVHDAARPLISDEVIGRVLAPLSEGFDGAVPTLPVVDTIKRVRGGEVVETVARADLVAAQTPQAFLADALRRAADGDGTDCASLVEARGGRIKAVDGDPGLVKVTSPDDLELVSRRLTVPERVPSATVDDD